MERLDGFLSSSMKVEFCGAAIMVVGHYARGRWFAALAWGISRGLLDRALWRRLFWVGAGWSLLLFNAAALVYDQKWDTEPVNVNFHPERLLDWSDPQWLAVLRALPSSGVRAAVGLALSLLVIALLLRLEGLWPRRLSSAK